MDEVVLCYSGKSRITADKIAESSDGRIRAVRQHRGDINWGRNDADTELNADTSRCVNKREMRELFRDNDVPMPELLDLNDTIALNYPVVGRPDQHMKGRGYWLCNNPRDIQRALSGTRRKAAATHFMAYIPNAKEIRVHIFNGKSLRISEKAFEGREGCHRLYTTIKPTVSSLARKKARKAAKKAVRALGLDFGAVDILVNGDNVYCLEVNSAPGLGGSLPRVYAEKILEYKEGV